MKRGLLPAILFVSCLTAGSQNFNVGVTFQYHILKQVSVEGSTIFPTGSYNYYRIIDNNWKFFSAGQSIVIGAVTQLDYKKFYFALEPSFELNTYNYDVAYTLSPTSEEVINFKTTFMQYIFPLYAGYQISSSNILRYSIFAGIETVIPFVINPSVTLNGVDGSIQDRYGIYDMKNVIYTNDVYLNGLVGVGIHFASIFRFDIRYKHRLSSPGETNRATFNTVGMGITYYLPLRLLKQKIYYEN